jgi:hypothetical protein
MKTFLAILGTLFLLAVLVFGIGGYWAYKNGGAKMAEAAQVQIDEFIKEKNPPAQAADSLRRVVNAAKTQDSMSSIMLATSALGSLEDKIVTPEEVALMDEGSALAEKGKISKDDLKAFVDKMQKVFPKMQKR